MIRLNETARALLAAASLFLTGAVVGVSVDRLVLIPTHAVASNVAAGHAMPSEHDAVLDELARDLALTPAQSEGFRTIFARHQAEIDRAWSAVHETLQNTIAAATTEVEGVLDGEQVVRLHEWLRERHGPIPGHAVGQGH
jgi:hypothetical protein